MPTYEYECSKCEDIFEVFQSMTDERIKKCPKCGGKVNRLFGTGSGVIFKGSGFYETDYRRGSYHNDAKKDSSSSDTTSESKESKAKSTDTSTKSDKSKSSSSSKSTKKSK